MKRNDKQAARVIVGWTLCALGCYLVAVALIFIPN